MAVRRCVGAEGDDEPSGAAFQGSELELSHLRFDAHELHQVFDLWGRLAVAIDELRADVEQLVVVLRLREALVEEEPLRHVRHVVIGDERRDAQCHVGGDLLSRRLAAQLADRLVHQLGVEVEPDRVDVAALIRPQDVSRAADFHVSVESRPQRTRDVSLLAAFRLRKKPGLDRRHHPLRDFERFFRLLAFHLRRLAWIAEAPSIHGERHSRIDHRRQRPVERDARAPKLLDAVRLSEGLVLPCQKSLERLLRGLLRMESHVLEEIRLGRSDFEVGRAQVGGGLGEPGPGVFETRVRRHGATTLLATPFPEAMP